MKSKFGIGISDTLGSAHDWFMIDKEYTNLSISIVQSQATPYTYIAWSQALRVPPTSSI